MLPDGGLISPPADFSMSVEEKGEVLVGSLGGSICCDEWVVRIDTEYSRRVDVGT